MLNPDLAVPALYIFFLFSHPLVVAQSWVTSTPSKTGRLAWFLSSLISLTLALAIAGEEG